ncbi:hypothetical protein RY972_19060 [Aeromonas allosaccharophila]|uniref:Uncharacterized protein n=1 Tax=Aeromonas allosaccharophila TaxID=656 RepID=A0ABZ0F913_9GAMM|nr:hypothetical protein [Aeromonas allosaccharophila]WOE66077.1 hypothetical protein RY972_19060 [Aeromonas allosaccharophila]
MRQRLARSFVRHIDHVTDFLFRPVPMAILPAAVTAFPLHSFLFYAARGDTPYLAFTGFFLPIQWLEGRGWRKAGSAVPHGYFPLLLA